MTEDKGGKAFLTALRIPAVIIVALGVLVVVYLLARGM
jgi:hypothetical protein